MPPIEEFRRSQERFYEALHRELLAFYAGRQPALRIEGIYSDYSDLFSPTAVTELKSQLEAVPESFPSQRKSLQRMHRSAVEQFLDSKLAGTEEEIATDSVSRSFEWKGDRFPLVRIPILLAGERSAARRKELQSIGARMLHEREDLHLRRLEELRSAAARLGHETALEALQVAAGLDYPALSSTMEFLLAATEPAYQERLATSFGMTAAIEAAEASAADVGYWERQNEPAALFPNALLLAAFNETFGLLDLEPQSGVLYDLENRAGKPGGFMCIPVRIPGEVHVLGSCAGGRSDFARLLHEGGHSHHFAWTSPSVSSEFRLAGDRGLCEAFGFVFEYLTLNEGWLMENLGYARPQSYLRFQALVRCYHVRREIGRLRFAISLYGKDGTREAAARYAEIMREHTGLIYEPALWLADAANAFRCADYLRGWMLAAMFGDYLRLRFGNAWHRSPAAGNLLKEIWETGQLYTADELARELGLGALDPQILADELRRGLAL